MGRNIPDEEKCQTWCGINLVNLCFFIATFDLVQSLYFLVHSVQTMIDDMGLYALVSFIGSVLWIVMVLVLFVGLCTLRVRFIIFWLVFSVIGIILDILFFIWTIAISDYVQGAQIVQFTLLYLGIVAEWLCIYTVYKYCTEIKISEVANPPEDDRIDLPNKEQSLIEPSSGKSEINSQKSGPKRKSLNEKIEIPRAADVSKGKRKAPKEP